MNYNLNDLGNAKLGDLAAEDYRYAILFKKYNLDFCCGGGQSVDQVCASNNIDAAELKDAIRALSPSDKPAGPDFKNMDAVDLVEHISSTHHVYVRENLPILVSFSQKVARVHGEAHPEVVEIAQVFTELANELLPHLQKEEMVLFPYIQEMADKGAEAAPPHFGTVNNPIRMMHHEHDGAGLAMKRIRQLSSGFTPPESACNTYKALYAGLKDFEDDLHMHVHLENNILFPKAIEMECALTA